MQLFTKIKTGHEQFPALTGIRAIGAAVVFVNHALVVTGVSWGLNVLSFFFVLSGFLIMYLYYPQQQTTRQWLSRYFINRFARIYPVYFLLITAAIIAKQDYRPIFLFKNYTLTHALSNKMQDIVIQPSWSLTVEECFYALMPVMMLLIRKHNLMGCLLFCMALCGAALGISFLGLPLLQTPVFIFSTTFFGHFFEFFAGIVLAHIVLHLQAQGNKGMGKPLYTLTGITGIIIVIILLEITDTLSPNSALVTRIAINNFLIAVPVAILYFGLIYERSLLSHILAGRVLGWLGRSSYAFYLLHILVIEYFAIPILYPYFKGIIAIYILVTYLITAIISLFIYVLYEEPLNRLIRRKTVAPATEPATDVVTMPAIK